MLPKREDASAEQSTEPEPPPGAPEGTGMDDVEVIGPLGLLVAEGTGIEPLSPPGSVETDDEGGSSMSEEMVTMPDGRKVAVDSSGPMKFGQFDVT